LIAIRFDSSRKKMEDYITNFSTLIEKQKKDATTLAL
jgi:hypothetical protein